MFNDPHQEKLQLNKATKDSNEKPQSSKMKEKDDKFLYILCH